MITVICGGMFSEKSTELHRRGKRLIRSGKNVGYFKPLFDNRYADDEIVTHDGRSVAAINISTDNPAELFCYENDYDVICIDEVQFFDRSIINIITILANEGKEVIVCGLDLDYQGNPFYITSQLMALAETVLKLHAVCSLCGQDSWVSHKDDNGVRIELGTEEYKPMCRKCFVNK